MGPQLKEKIQTLYPAWHDQPLRLSLEELMQPHRVFAEFFDTYNLPAIRACLRQWLEDSLRAEEVAAADHYFTCNHIERLVEAAWLLHDEDRNAPPEPYEECDTHDIDESLEEEEAAYNDSPQTVYRHLPPFDRIHLRSACHVVLEHGIRENLRMQGPADALQAISIEVDDKQTLLIQSASTAYVDLRHITLYITYTELKLLATCSTGTIRSAGTIREAALHLVQNGTGSLHLSADIGSLQVIIHGAGNVDVSGTAFHTHIITYGPGHFNGQHWRTRAATVFLSGSGDVTLSVGRRLEGSVGGSGRLNYRGAPAFRALQLSEDATAIDLDEQDNLTYPLPL